MRVPALRLHNVSQCNKTDHKTGKNAEDDAIEQVVADWTDLNAADAALMQPKSLIQMLPMLPPPKMGNPAPAPAQATKQLLGGQAAAAAAAAGPAVGEPATQAREKVKIGLLSEDNPVAWRFFKRRVIEARKLNHWTYANVKSQVKIAITGDAASTSQDIDIGEDFNALDAAGNLHPHTCKNSRPDLSQKVSQNWQLHSSDP